MSVIQIDLSEDAPIQKRGEFPVVPAGRYVVEITGFEDRVAASTGNKGYLVKATVLWPEEIQAGSGDPDDYIGTPLIDAFYGKMILPALVNAFDAIGVPEDEAKLKIRNGFDTSEVFIGKQVVWDVVVNTVSKGVNIGKKRNNVTSWSNVANL